MKILNELSKPFTQSESNRSRKFGGLGLGLSLCKHQVLSGELVIESKQNEGTNISNYPHSSIVYGFSQILKLL